MVNRSLVNKALRLSFSQLTPKKSLRTLKQARKIPTLLYVD